MKYRTKERARMIKKQNQDITDIKEAEAGEFRIKATGMNARRAD